MKFSAAIRYSLFAIFLLLLLNGCKQKLDINSPVYVEVPVIYGLLNLQDATHYIRIQKGYLYNGDAHVAAGIADSIYYPDVLKVTIKGSNGTIYNLKRVDGNSLGLPKDPGVFANDSNFLYSFKGTLDPAQTYTLTVVNTTNGKTDSATTAIIMPFAVNFPRYGDPVGLSNNKPNTITWATAANAGIYDLTVRFNFSEFNANNSFIRDTFIDIPFFQSSSIPYSQGFGTAKLTEDQVIKYMEAQIEAHPYDPTVAYRAFNRLKGMQFKFAAGGTELANFINSGNIQRNSITSSNSLPLYTNIAGGIGLFSSRVFVEIDSVLLTNDGLDSLACGVDSKNLHFRGSTGQTCN